MKRLLLVLALLWATEAQAFDRANWFSTRGVRAFGKALTDGGIFGAPRHTTALLPTCNTANTGGIAFDTTVGAHVSCNGTAWSTLGGFSGGTVEDATVFTDTVTFGTALDAANSITFNQTTGCVEFEGSSADTSETTLCVTNPSGDSVFNLPNIGGATRTLAMSDHTQAWTAIQTFTGTLNYVGGVTAVTGTTATTAATSAATFTNTGDTDGAAVTLLDNAGAGTWWNFAITVAQTLTITPATGESLYLGADQCLASITSNVVGSTLTIRTVVGGSGGVFMAFGSQGTWVCND